MPRKPKEAPIACEHFAWHLRRKTSGVYFADGRINREYLLGKPSLGTRDRKEAIQRLHTLDKRKAVELGLAQPTIANEREGVGIDRGWQLYMERCESPEILGGVSVSTQKRYKAVRDKHSGFCREKGYGNWSEITKPTTQQYGVWLAKKDYADRSIVLELNVICSIVKWLVEEEHLPAGCRFLLKLSKPDGSSTFCYSKEQVVRMVGYCNSAPQLAWLGHAITALATTGLRINELAGLRWSDIDFDANTLRLTDERSRARRKQTGSERRIKGKRGRAIPMHTAFRNLLEKLPRHADGIVFRGENGKPLVDRRVLEGLQRRVIVALKEEFPTPHGEAGFADGTVHGLRHFFCSEAYRNGAKDAELLEWLGHRDSEIMKLYRHLRSEDGQRTMKHIDFLGRDDEEAHTNGVA